MYAASCTFDKVMSTVLCVFDSVPREQSKRRKEMLKSPITYYTPIERCILAP